MTVKKTLLAILLIGLLIMVGVGNGVDNRNSQVTVFLNIAPTATIAIGPSISLINTGDNKYTASDSISINWNYLRGFTLRAFDTKYSQGHSGFMGRLDGSLYLNDPLEITFPYQSVTPSDPQDIIQGASESYPYVDGNGATIDYSNGQIGFSQQLPNNPAAGLFEMNIAFVISPQMEITGQA